MKVVSVLFAIVVVLEFWMRIESSGCQIRNTCMHICCVALTPVCRIIGVPSDLFSRTRCAEHAAYVKKWSDMTARVIHSLWISYDNGLATCVVGLWRLLVASAHIRQTNHNWIQLHCLWLCWIGRSSIMHSESVHSCKSTYVNPFAATPFAYRLSKHHMERTLVCDSS